VQNRQADLSTVQQPVINRLLGLSASEISPRWLANAIDVRVPAKLAATLATWPEIALLEHDVPTVSQGTSGDGYYGGDRRTSIEAQRFIGDGYVGSYGDGASEGSPVRIGNVAGCNASNNDLIPENHPGFKNTSGATRFYQDNVCSATVYNSCSAAGNPTGQTHDTVVMGVMAGGIENGQDPNYPGSHTSAQADRSGIAPGSQLEYYGTGGATCTTTAAAIAMQAAVGAGVDILNNSWNAGTNPGPSTDYSALNEQIQNAFAAGVVVVFSAGDSNGTTFSTTCNQGYPSNRPEVLSANGMDTVYTGTGGLQSNPTLLAGAWATSGCTIDAYAANGTTTYATTSNSVAAVADGQVGLSYYWNSTTSYGYSGNWVGSSFAAPMVAGAAGLLQSAWYQIGGTTFTNYTVMSNLMMLTDGYSFGSYSDGGTGRLSGGTSQYSGTGRLQLHVPVYTDFSNSNWGWEWTAAQVTPGQTYTYQATYPLTDSSGDVVQHFRTAFFWQEKDLTKVADIDLYIDAVNSSGTVCSSAFAYQDDESIINAVHVLHADIPTCALPYGWLQVRINVYGMPANQTRTLYISDSFDSDSGY
jgi:hypothetical protein